MMTLSDLINTVFAKGGDMDSFLFIQHPTNDNISFPIEKTNIRVDCARDIEFFDFWDDDFEED